MFNDRFAQLMARKLSGEATEAETEELLLFLRQNPEAHYFFEVFSDYWKLEPRREDDEIQEEVHFQQIIAIAEKDTAEVPEPVFLSEAPSPVLSLRRMAAAAVVILTIATVYIIYSRKSTPRALATMAVNEVVARPGARSYLLLPDGSKVWLNSASRIEYKGNFNDSIREVSLEGEAFFDVVKDKTRPFIVHTSDIDIRVLGTAFNVKSYPKDPSIETTLIHGMIEVTNKKEPTSPKVILRPHEKLVFSKEAALEQSPDHRPEAPVHRPFAVTALPKNIADSAVVETSWVYNKLVFDGETFREIASKMERWYNRQIIFRNEAVADIPIHVAFRDETVEEALKALQLIVPFEYRINGDEIEILKK